MPSLPLRESRGGKTNGFLKLEIWFFGFFMVFLVF